MPESLNIGQNSDGGISDFLISSQSIGNKNCHNCRTSYGIDINPGPVTKLDKRNMVIAKNFVMISRWQIATCHFSDLYIANLG